MFFGNFSKEGRKAKNSIRRKVRKKKPLVVLRFATHLNDRSDNCSFREEQEYAGR